MALSVGLPALIVSIISLAVAKAQTSPGAAGTMATSPGAPAVLPKTDAAPATAATGNWRAPGTASRPSGDSTGPTDTMPPLQPVPRVAGLSREPIAKYTKGPGSLPNDAGQEWRDYDISAYTTRVTSSNRPEQAIVDWILRETGYEAWHSEPLGVLSANRRTLRVYHTPEMQAVVSEMVDRFVNSEAETQSFGLRILSIGSPNWRAKSHRLMRPVAAQSQGVQAWLLAKEDAALLLADLRKRTDFREHSAPHMLVNNGQSTVVSATRPKNYVRDVLVRGDVWPGYQPEPAQIDEGFSMELSPLLSIDGRSIDAIIKCNVDQVEKLIPVMVDVPTSAAPRQRTKIEIPQVTSCRLHERFRWPTDQVLLISLGVVASPSPSAAGSITAALPLTGAPSRSDLLVFVESKGKAAPPPTALRAAPRAAGAGARSPF